MALSHLVTPQPQPQPLALREPQMNGLGATLLHQGAGLAPSTVSASGRQEERLLHCLQVGIALCPEGRCRASCGEKRLPGKFLGASPGQTPAYPLQNPDQAKLWK